MKLANIKELQPVSSDLLEEVSRLMAERTSDPVRIQQLVADLGGTNEQRLLAEHELKNGGQAIIVPLLNMLQHSPTPEEERNVLAPIMSAFRASGYDYKALARSIVTHPIYREVR